MADTNEPEIATKAPESDAGTEQPAPRSQSEQDAPTIGDHCVSDRPTPVGASSSGEIIKLDDIETYVSKPSDYPHSPSKLLLFLSSGTGIHSTNNQIQADQFAKEGFLVVMPDQFNKDPAPNTSEVNAAANEATPSVIEQIKQHATEAAKSFLIDMWLARQTPEKVMPVLERAIKAAKEEFADAFSSGGGLYAVGYCFGGKYVLQLASSKEEKKEDAVGQDGEEEGLKKNTGGPAIKAGAFAHGTLITSQDFQNVKAPICVVAVENDQLFSDDHRKAGQERLEKGGVEHELKVYPGVPHGFAVTGEYEDEKVKTAQEEAFAQMLAWLKNH